MVGVIGTGAYLMIGEAIVLAATVTGIQAGKIVLSNHGAAHVVRQSLLLTVSWPVWTVRCLAEAVHEVAEKHANQQTKETNEET